MKTFYQLLVNSLIANVTNNFVWFALIFWAFLETDSVLATSFSAGIYVTATALCGFWFGGIVDHHKKKWVMLVSSAVTLVFFILGLVVYSLSPETVFTTVASWQLWTLVLILLFGVIAGNLRNIALPTMVTLLVDEKERDKANGLVGTVTGITFAITSVASGLAVGFLGMQGVLVIAVILTMVAFGHMWFVSIHEKGIAHVEGVEKPKHLDIKGTIRIISAIPGLFALIFFTMFNNFLGGVFMALMDAYGLSLMSVQAWGLLFGVLSVGFIAGGLIIAKWGLGKNPLQTLIQVNLIMWTVSMFFTIQPWIWLLALGIFIWICLAPFAEATEQTIIQKVVPQDRQGRVFGFAQSVEQSASPVTAFVIGPIAQYIFIPFMTTGAGVELIGDWYGTGTGRGIALVFTAAGFVGLCVTLWARRSKSYSLLSERYVKNGE